MIGKKLGHYEITSHLGSGGMGDVYQATDSKLGRSVAIKFLPAAFASDAERLARFRREAQLLASLNHPNIAQVYGLEEWDETRCIVMELVEGETLQARIMRGPLPTDEALTIAKQIAEALEAAHEKNVIHRDLKPGNVMLTVEGRVKVLDFGLAKVYEANPAAILSDSPTATGVAGTNAGVILGTAPYMSPEQASNGTVDKRSDIWSFAVVLWELLTGHPLFEGETVSHTIAGVLRDPIDFKKLPGETPGEIRALLRRCLDRNVKNRLRDIGEARITIESALMGKTPLFETAPKPRAARHVWLAWATATLAMGLASVAFLQFREKLPPPAVPLRFQIPVPPNAAWLVLSPDGRKATFVVGANRIWVHFLESGESRDLAAAEAAVPFWSPDSRFIAFVSQGKLKKIEAAGGPPQTVADLPSGSVWGGGAWSQNDVIVFGNRPVGLFRVPASGGIPVQITSLDSARHENSQYGPRFLLDGLHFVYIRSSTDEGKTAIYLGSVDAKPEQQSAKTLVTTNSEPVYAASPDPNIGYILFARGVTLMAQPFDNRRLEVTGEALPVAEQVRDNIIGASYIGLTASATGAVGFQHYPPFTLQLNWFDRKGNVIETLADQPSVSAFNNPSLSPDGTRVAVMRSTGGADAARIWLMDLSRRAAVTPFTFGSLIDNNPVWSPDSSLIIFSSNRDGPYNLYERPVNGSKGEDILFKSNDDKFPTSWSRDGRFLLYRTVHPKTKNDIWVLPLDNSKKPFPFLTTDFNETQARISPDGHWVAYVSDESGQPEIYVRSFSVNSNGTSAEAGAKWPISNGFGTDPRWRNDGREFFYRSRTGGLAVEIATNPTFRAGKPEVLGAFIGAGWDVAPDGMRFLSVARKGELPSFTVMLNWQGGLKK